MGEKIFQSDSGPSTTGNGKKRKMSLGQTTIGLVTEGQAVEGLKKRIVELESRLTIQVLEVGEHKVMFVCMASLILSFQGDNMRKANEAAERRRSGLKSSPVATFSDGSTPSAANGNEMNTEQISHE